MKKIILLFSLFLSATGCQTPVPAKSQSLEFYVRFLQTEQQWRAEATVREAISGQTALAVQLTEGLKFEGKEMQWLNAGQSYKTEFAGGAQPEFSFTWKNSGGQPRQFKMAMPKIDDFDFSEKKLSRSKVARLTWQGQSLGENEQLLLFWENPEHGVVQMPVSGAAAVPMLEIPAAKMGELKTGEWQLYLVRKKAFKKKDEVEAKGLVEFYSKTKNFAVMD